MLRALAETDQGHIGSLPGGHDSDVGNVDSAGDHLVAEVRDHRCDERQPIPALVGDQHSEMLGLAIAHRRSLSVRSLSQRLRASKGGLTASRLRVWSVSASPQTSASESFRLRPSAGVWAYRPQRSPPSTPTLGAHMSVTAEKATDATAIRPFQVEVPEEDLDDLRQRIAATRWPTRELVDDRSQGVQLATMKALADHWQRSTTGARARRNSTRCPSSRPRSTASTSTSSTCARSTRTRCR
jgi:Epoxide hydrolase N terminus